MQIKIAQHVVVINYTMSIVTCLREEGYDNS